jgi:hypothetical protein
VSLINIGTRKAVPFLWQYMEVRPRPCMALGGSTDNFGQNKIEYSCTWVLALLGPMHLGLKTGPL